MNGRCAARNGSRGSCVIRLVPALALIAAAPMITQRSGDTSCGFSVRKKIR